MTKVLVCGGRDFADWDFLRSELDRFHVVPQTRITQLIHGGARGADTMAEHWAELNMVKIQPFVVKAHEWRALGSAAGPLRNQKMLDEGKPDVVLAFPGGGGTKDMMTKARKAGVKVICIGWDG